MLTVVFWIIVGILSILGLLLIAYIGFLFFGWLMINSFIEEIKKNGL